MTTTRKAKARDEITDRLAAALADMIDAVQFMSGSADFGEGGKAQAGWLKVRPKLFAAMDALEASAPVVLAKGAK